MSIKEQREKNEAEQRIKQNAEKTTAGVDKTEGAIEAEKLAEKTRESAEKSGQKVEQSGEKSQGTIEAEQLAERAKLAQEEQKQRAQQQVKQKEIAAQRAEKKEEFKQSQEAAAAKLHFSLVERVKAMRAQDEKLISEKKEAMLEKADLQKMVEKGEKPGLKLERGGDEKKEIQPEIEKQFDGDLRGLGTTHSSGFGQMSKSVAMNDFVPERSLAGAGTEHLATYHGADDGVSSSAWSNQLRETTPAPTRQSTQQAEVVTEKTLPAEAPTPAPVQQQQAEAPELELPPPQTELEKYDQRFGAEAIEGTQAYKDRDEADAERGRGYRELPADQVTEERTRDDDGFSDLVPPAKKAENEAENENGRGEGGSSAKEPKAQEEEAEKTAAPAPEPEYDYDDDFGR